MKSLSIQCMGGLFYAAEIKKMGMLYDYHRAPSVCGYGVFEWTGDRGIIAR